MPQRPLFWPMLAYGALMVVAVARKGVADRASSQRSVPERPRADLQERRGHESARAVEPDPRAPDEGRGRRASAPWRIPWRGWKDILWRVYEKINDNRLMAVAAGVVFYCLLAFFPAITAFATLYGLIADPSKIDSYLASFSGVLPSGARDILHEQLGRLTASKSAGKSIGFAVSLIVALWSANAGMKAVIDSLNVAYEEKEKRSFIRLNLISLLYTLIAMASLMVAIGVVVVVPIALGQLGLGGAATALIAILRWPVLFVLVVIALAAAYRYTPCRREPRWQWLAVGSVAAAAVWIVSSLLFSWYIANFGNYNITYGSLGAAIGMMMWMWISMIVVLIGAQLNAEIEHQTARDSTVGSQKPLGERGARMADTIGAAKADTAGAEES
jgi:membrane protein